MRDIDDEVMAWCIRSRSGRMGISIAAGRGRSTMTGFSRPTVAGQWRFKARGRERPDPDFHFLFFCFYVVGTSAVDVSSTDVAVGAGSAVAVDVGTTFD